MLGGNAVMGSDEPRFNVAEDGVDDREELGRIRARALHDRRVANSSNPLIRASLRGRREPVPFDLADARGVRTLTALAG